MRGGIESLLSLVALTTNGGREAEMSSSPGDGAESIPVVHDAIDALSEAARARRNELAGELHAEHAAAAGEHGYRATVIHHSPGVGRLTTPSP
jgi:hypothetical protein